MQRHVMSKHSKACLTPFQTVAMPSQNVSLKVSLQASFHMHGSRVDQVWKDGLGSISITASFRGNLPSPGGDSLVLFTMATCVYRNASNHAIH